MGGTLEASTWSVIPIETTLSVEDVGTARFRSRFGYSKVIQHALQAIEISCGGFSHRYSSTTCFYDNIIVPPGLPDIKNGCQ